MMKRWWRCVVRHTEIPDSIEAEWVEEMCLDISPEECIEGFNNSLRPGEKLRTLIAAIPINKDSVKPHIWGKCSLVTEVGVYDHYRCKHCGAFGKRYGLSDTIIPDKKGGCR